MTNIVQSVGEMVGAGVKGLMDMAEGYISPEETGHSRHPLTSPPPTQDAASEDGSTRPIDSVSNVSAHSLPASTASSLSGHSLPPTDSLVETTDIAAGWIHIPAAYLDEGGNGSGRVIKSFGLRNLVGSEVRVDVGSDMRDQVTFWIGDDEPMGSGTSSASSTSSNPTAAISTTLAPHSSTIIYLAFQPTPQKPAATIQPLLEEDATPRVGASQPKSSDSLISPPPSLSSLSRSGASDSSGPSVPSSFKSTLSTGSRKQEPIHRAFSIHGLITIRASTMLEVALDPENLSPTGPTALLSRQTLNIPLFATVCRSLFTAALIDPESGRTSGLQLSSGKLELDFGPDSVIGGSYHRDILLVNRSEIELVWSTAVVNAQHKEAAWFSLRDLDSENVFGVDTSSQPVPLPPLSSRHLRLELRVRSPITDFDFDFLISNVNQPGNVVTCHAVGSGIADATDKTLKILSETSIDFGQICDGVWTKRVVSLKNTGDKALDVKFSADPGVDVCFRLAGVAGDDMDDDVPKRAIRGTSASGSVISGASGSERRSASAAAENRRGRPRDASVSRKSSRGASPSSSIGHESSSMGGDDSPYLPAHQMSADLTRHLSALDGGGTSRSVLSSDRSNHSARDPSQPPSRGLSRVTSRTSSYLRNTSTESEEEDGFDIDAGILSNANGADSLGTSPVDHHPIHRSGSGGLTEAIAEKAMPNLIEELTMRPGTEYRVLLLYRSAVISGDSAFAGQLREHAFKVYLDSSSSKPSSTTRRTLKCSSRSCTSLITIASGGKIDFGEVTVGASKTATITIQNLSALSARVEIAAISKVLSANRNVIVIPPMESVEERIEFFPRRINEKYEKQIFVRNLLNRANDQLLEIRSKNVDVYNLTIHSHLYRILTPSGSNFLDFGSVIINSPTIRVVQFENLTNSPLLLDLMASQPEDVELFLKAEDAPKRNITAPLGKYPAVTSGIIERVTSPPTAGGELKERFMETMRELSDKADKGESKAKTKKTKEKVREKSDARSKAANHEENGGPSKSIGAVMVAALKKGSRGKPVQLYGNAVVYKDRSLLEDHEYLDLAAGPPVAAHRSSPRSKRTQLLDSIELEDKTKLSGQHPKIPKLDFAASAKATGLLRKDPKSKKKSSPPTAEVPISPKLPIFTTPAPSITTTSTATVVPNSPSTPVPSLASVMTAIASLSDNAAKSPALTAKRVDPKDVGGDVSKMTVDELLIAIERQDSQKTSITHATLDEEEAYVRRAMTLRKELQNLISTTQLVPARTLSVGSKGSCKLIVIMTPNGSTRPHVSTKAKRADSRIFIKLGDFDRSLLNGGGAANGAATADLGDLPVRDLVIRSSCVRSVLEVGQSSINFGGCEKGEVKSKTIVVQNKSDCIGMFRLRTSGSIASGDLKLGQGRYGVIAAFGRKEVEQFSFTPSLTGNYQENLTVENVLDGYNEIKIGVKAVVRKAAVVTVDTTAVDFGAVDVAKLGGKKKTELGVVITNVSKHERTFVVNVKPVEGDTAVADDVADTTAFAEVSLSTDEKSGGMALSKGEEEEVETMLQKLKIARRKGKADKIAKYEARLKELGIVQPNEDGSAQDGESEAGADSTSGSTVGTPLDDRTHGLGILLGMTPEKSETPAPVRSLTITLGPNQKTRVCLELVPAAFGGDAASKGRGEVNEVMTVHDRKNTDETISVTVKAVEKDQEKEALVPAVVPAACHEPLHQQIMMHCLKLTLQCPVSQTAFCVGSTLFLPDTSDHFRALKAHFPSFPPRDPDPAGLILADGWSRQIPGNTHAEANALANFRTKYAELFKRLSAPGESGHSATSSASSASSASSDSSVPTVSTTTSVSAVSTADGIASGTGTAEVAGEPSITAVTLPPIEDVLAEADCYATMEPCSVRTSGGPSCALELVRAKVRRVYLGVEEPLDFVKCEGVEILEKGGVEVERVRGLEEQCLKAARRGRS